MQRDNKVTDLRLMCMYYQDIIIPTNKEPFFNIQCGRASTKIQLDMAGDDTGDSLSSQNLFWSEITGLYWAWKNLEKSEFIGLCSYRRFFNFEQSSKPIEIVKTIKAKDKIFSINYDLVGKIFDDFDVILPVPYTYAWSIRRVCSKNYRDTDFTLLEKILKEVCPDYYSSYEKVMYKSNNLIGHNMFIMKWDEFQNYCKWVFDILIPISKIIDPSDYPINQQRVFGYMHELLLAVYVEHKKFKVYRSQIAWVEDKQLYSRFNKISYRYSAKMVYSITKILGRFYPHIIVKE
jgi:hypothetical protein